MSALKFLIAIVVFVVVVAAVCSQNQDNKTTSLGSQINCVDLYDKYGSSYDSFLDFQNQFCRR